MILAIVVTFSLVRPFTTLFHELGHVIPAIFLTKDRVTMYVGSYGDPQHSLNFSVGRIKFYFKYNPALWKVGLCVPHAKEVTINRQILITFGGPILSLFLASIACYIAFQGDLSDIVKFVSVIFLISSFYDFIINIVPSSDPIQLYDGSLVYNDGQQLRQLFKYKTLPSQYTIAAEYYNHGDFVNAAQSFHQIVKNGLMDHTIYRLTVDCYIKTGEFETAMGVNNEFGKYLNFNSEYYSNSALIKSHRREYESAMIDYDKSLELNPENLVSLSNRGYTHLLLEEYEQAISDFDEVIKYEPDSSYTKSNRGLAKIKLGRESEGLKEIEMALETEPQNSYAHRNLGIYYFDKGDFSKALECFETAYNFNMNTHLLTEYMARTKEKIEGST